MRLQKIQVTNFRSVDDSEHFDVDPVTCLVGKNEAGKSAILLAIAALNPNKATPVTLDKERDYPRRHLTRYTHIHGNEDAVVVQTIWQLDKTDTQAIAEDLGEDILESPLVEVSRRYGHDIEIDVQLNHSAAVKHHLDLFALNASERSMLKSPKTTDELIEALNGLPSPTEKHSLMQQYLTEHGNAITRVQNHVRCALPSFMYISSYDRMDGAIQIEDTQRKIASKEIYYDEHRGSRLFTEFLEYAGVALDSITNVSTYETFNAMLQAASSNITEQILEYWSQNPDLDVEVRIDKARPGDQPPFNEGTIARARIKNNLHRVDTPFSERSAGFVWFFSFLVKFAQVKNAGGHVVLLLDEPGLSLHGKAQGDLLRFIDDKLAPFHQVIYSTHSPFMVPADKLQRGTNCRGQSGQKKDTAQIVWDQSESGRPQGRSGYALSVAGRFGLRGNAKSFRRRTHSVGGGTKRHPISLCTFQRTRRAWQDRIRFALDDVPGRRHRQNHAVCFAVRGKGLARRGPNR